MGEGSIKDEAWSNYTFITLTLLNLQISLLCVFPLIFLIEPRQLVSE